MIERVMPLEVLPEDARPLEIIGLKLKSGARTLVNANESSCPGCSLFPATRQYSLDPEIYVGNGGPRISVIIVLHGR